MHVFRAKVILRSFTVIAKTASFGNCNTLQGYLSAREMTPGCVEDRPLSSNHQSAGDQGTATKP
jgi:hypothetical protein